MNIEEIRAHCLAKPFVSEEFPFGEDVLVYKVAGKIFLLTGLNSYPPFFNVKMDVSLVPSYREKYEDVKPAYHMNKKMWNSVYFSSGRIPRGVLFWMIDHSYLQVVNNLPKKIRHQISAT
ncbi:MAG: MmcQ/YjbR family DNA-binding protein [Chitinophagales bacterium]|nr:MmcQ/YjbR family DNA-binding protein [Chitinophagales bacterium]MDW8418298.1 MmcQ/YjbR family DNA-binding protein [Chitinophagales bacterium]